MRKVVAAFLAVILLLPLFPGNARGEGASIEFQEANLDSVKEALLTIVRFASDDIKLGGGRKYPIAEKSPAMEILKSFDGGWFSTATKREFSNLRTENWDIISENEFYVDTYFDYGMQFNLLDSRTIFHCAYRLCMRKSSVVEGLWQAYDFWNLPIEEQAEKAGDVSDGLEGIRVYPVTGKTYKGYMTVVDDPSRIFVGAIERFGEDYKGKTIADLTSQYGAVGGINAGGFTDPGGSGKGGDPNGVVISQGVSRRGYHYRAGSVMIGFDTDNRLHVGEFKSIEGMNIRDAASFDYALVLEGKDVSDKVSRIRYTTRTAIGQDADVKVLMLVIEGRSPDSLGASHADLAKIMLEYGAVTAGNLDGGSSTALYLGGKSVYSGIRIDSSRRIPVAFLISPVK